MINIYAHFDLRVTALPHTGVSKHINQMVTGLAKKKDFNVCLLASRDQAVSEDLLAKFAHEFSYFLASASAST